MIENRKSLFKILFILLMLVLIGSGSIKAHASGGGIGNGNGGGTDGEVDPNASSTGVSKNRSGYLVYLVNKDTGEVTSPVVLVPYNSAPASNVNTTAIRTRLTGQLFTYIYSGNISLASNGEINYPPFTVDGYAAGVPLKSKLLELNSSGDAKVYDFIGNVLGVEYKDQFKNQDERLCIECVAWTGFTSGGNLYAYTSKTGAEIANTYGYSYLLKFWKQRLPRCMFLDYSWASHVSPSDAGVDTSGSIPLSTTATPEIGLGMIMIAPSEPTEPEEADPPAESASDDYLKAHELNYAFPDVINDSNDNRTYDLYTTGYNMGLPAVWNKHVGEGYDKSELKDNQWQIVEEITCDLVNFYGKGNCLFYRVRAGQFANPTAEKNFAKGAGIIKPGYGYMYSRALFGDNLVVCDYKGAGKTNEEFITTRLKLTLGHGASSGLNVGVNQELKSSIVKNSEYTFYGSATEEYEHNDKIHHDAEYNEDGTEKTAAYDEDNWVEYSETYTDPSVTYRVSHGIYKYTPLDLNTPNCPSAGDTILRTGNVGRAWTRVAFGSEAGTLSLYPEVAYTMYIEANNNIFEIQNSLL